MGQELSVHIFHRLKLRQEKVKRLRQGHPVYPSVQDKLSCVNKVAA